MANYLVFLFYFTLTTTIFKKSVMIIVMVKLLDEFLYKNNYSFNK